MSKPSSLSVRETQCLREAKALMDAIVSTLPPDFNPNIDTQVESVVAMAGNLGADRFRTCMTRPVQKR